MRAHGGLIFINTAASTRRYRAIMAPRSRIREQIAPANARGRSCVAGGRLRPMRRA